MPLTVCFIDDSPFEREIFTQVYGSAGRWELVVVESFDRAREVLGDRIPLLWLLDLWGNDPRGADPAKLIGPGELQKKAARINPLEAVWEGLDDFPGDRPNEYLKRLYTIVSGWSSLFMEAAEAADQTKAYGLFNLARVREHYPGTAALAYTRKSQSTDLAAFLAAGGDGAMLKPHGPDDNAIWEITRRKAPELTTLAEQTLARCLEAALLRQALASSGPEGAYFFSLAGTLARGLPLPPFRELEAGPYLVRWAQTARAWLEDRPAGS